ncbi:MULTISPECIES: DUF721 domain-containing protein [Cobetia]|jgi:hypothetical protein|uniref:DUF721 domain-containing protein n=1 Tax=Cobetia TaxID=204286 RepID=UPI000865AAD7|nr:MULTISPECIES: DciA family protein [Cobetia]AOM02114.1 hypothetical protein BFX80_13465 [Cobetia marina]MDA5563654.1 DciA family protein [Cobetia sp. MMG027]MDI6003886.1 DciA family protein [Cobetia pacifica]MDN2654918.1 DciA family protein [Cobetia sp. 14N.309.X.WAT.E.A4]POR08298.1 hypothetical protein BOH68_01300 [Cobetia sp. MM1IDA2H-1]
MSIKAKRFRAQPAARLLNGKGQLGNVMRQARMLEQAQWHLREALPTDMQEQVFVGGYHEGTLTLITNRASWLTWLRYEQRRLISVLREIPELAALTRLNFKVRPVRPVFVPAQQPRHLPAAAAEHLLDCASHTRDEHLRRSLERLAAHADDLQDTPSGDD